MVLVPCYRTYLPVTQLKEISLQSTVLEFNDTQQRQKPLTGFLFTKFSLSYCS